MSTILQHYVSNIFFNALILIFVWPVLNYLMTAHGHLLYFTVFLSEVIDFTCLYTILYSFVFPSVRKVCSICQTIKTCINIFSCHFKPCHDNDFLSLSLSPFPDLGILFVPNFTIAASVDPHSFSHVRHILPFFLVLCLEISVEHYSSPPCNGELWLQAFQPLMPLICVFVILFPVLNILGHLLSLCKSWSPHVLIVLTWQKRN